MNRNPYVSAEKPNLISHVFVCVCMYDAYYICMVYVREGAYVCVGFGCTWTGKIWEGF